MGEESWNSDTIFQYSEVADYQMVLRLHDKLTELVEKWIERLSDEIIELTENMDDVMKKV